MTSKLQTNRSLQFFLLIESIWNGPYDIILSKFIYEDLKASIFKFIYLFIYLDQRAKMP